MLLEVTQPFSTALRRRSYTDVSHLTQRRFSHVLRSATSTRHWNGERLRHPTLLSFSKAGVTWTVAAETIVTPDLAISAGASVSATLSGESVAITTSQKLWPAKCRNLWSCVCIGASNPLISATAEATQETCRFQSHGSHREQSLLQSSRAQSRPDCRQLLYDAKQRQQQNRR